MEVFLCVQLLFVTCTENGTVTSGWTPKEPTGWSCFESAFWVRVPCWNIMPPV